MDTESKIKCVLCNSDKFANYFYPPNRFNNTIFSYYQCKSCNAAFVHPLPTKNDFDLIYGTEDHTYLKALKPDEKLIFNYKYPKYNHQGFQIQFLEKYYYIKPAKRLLDIGCGSGFYMNYAKQKGMEVVGVEYDSSFANLLREKTDLNIFSFDEFENKYNNQKFDLIHAGHILEHLVEPQKMLTFIKRFSHDDTIIIVDGPLESNFHLSGLLIKFISILKGKKENDYPPQHITFTDKKSQLSFFEKNGLETIRFNVVEQFHPLPSQPNIKSPISIVLYFFGLVSINFSMLNRSWGNVFHYAGKVRK